MRRQAQLQSQLTQSSTDSFCLNQSVQTKIESSRARQNLAARCGSVPIGDRQAAHAQHIVVAMAEQADSLATVQLWVVGFVDCLDFEDFENAVWDMQKFILTLHHAMFKIVHRQQWGFMVSISNSSSKITGTALSSKLRADSLANLLAVLSSNENARRQAER